METGNVEAFATKAAVSLEDWNQVLPKVAGVTIEHPLGDDPERELRRSRKAVADSGRRLLEIAQRSGIDSERVRFHLNEVTARSAGADAAPRDGALCAGRDDGP